MKYWLQVVRRNGWILAAGASEERGNTGQWFVEQWHTCMQEHNLNTELTDKSSTRFLALRATARWNVLPRLTRSGTGISSRSMNNYLEVNCSLLVIFSVDYQSWSATKKLNRKTIEKLTWNGLSKPFDGDWYSICWICINFIRKVSSRWTTRSSVY